LGALRQPDRALRLPDRTLRLPDRTLAGDEPESRWAQAGPDGRVHRIVDRPWRSPGGVAVEAEEDGEPFDGGARSGHHSQFDGFCAEVLTV